MLILNDLTSQWAPANSGQREVIREGRRVTLRGDFYTEIAEGVEFLENAEAPGSRARVSSG
jgi:hypothetical protein